MSVTLFQRAVGYAQEVISNLGDDDLRRPTPCEDWDAGRVVLHLADVADSLISLVDTGHLAMPDAPRTDDPDPAATLRASMDKLTTTLLAASETERADAAARAGAIEFTMHGWDIGVAHNQDHATPGELANDVLALVSSLLSNDARGSNFAQPVNISNDLSPGDRLAAFLGRQRPT